MATFTMELQQVIESLYNESSDPDDYVQEYSAFSFNDVTYGKLPTLPDYDKIGLGYYPIFNEDYRPILNGKIIDEYYLQEIGVETIEMFVLSLRRKMDQIMPYFNQLYESTQLEYTALDTMRIHSVGKNNLEGEETGDATNNTKSKSDSSGRAVGSDFPQTMLAGNGDYARNGSDSSSKSNVDSDVTQNSKSNNKTETNSDNLVTGYQGAASDLINKFRATFINIDTAVIAEIEDCFMLVLNNGDEYFSSPYWR